MKNGLDMKNRLDTTDRRALPSAVAVAVFAVGAAAAAVAAPLWVYAGSLALFGVPHVLAEMRYVDGRFGRRFPRGQVMAIVALLGLAVAMRAAAFSGVVEVSSAAGVELGLVAVMAFVAVPSLLATPGRAAVALLAGGALAAGSWAAPLTTLVILAVLHNVTPAGFLVERFGATFWCGRRGAGLIVLFVAMPIWIAAVAPIGHVGMTGDVTPHLAAFVPRGWFGAEAATRLFMAATYLQLMHYGAVLLVLPRLLDASDAPLVRWPRARVVALSIAAAGLVAAVLFAQNFRGTRAAYGVLASVHAWIEIPVLLLAMSAAGVARERGAPKRERAEVRAGVPQVA